MLVRLGVIAFILIVQPYANQVRKTRFERYHEKLDLLRKQREEARVEKNTPVPEITKYSSILIKDTNKQGPVVLRLWIEDLVKEAVRRNASVIFHNLQQKIANQQIAYEKGQFATNFFLSSKRNIIDQPNSTQEALTRSGQAEFESSAGEYEMGFGGTSYRGMEWGIKVNYQKENSSVIEQMRNIPMEYTDSVDLSLKVPMRKNKGRDITQIKVDLAKAGHKLSLAEYQRELMDVIGLVIQNYWKLYGAQKLNSSWEESLKLAEKQLEDLKVRVESGNAASTDLLSLESAIALRKIEISSNKAQMEQIQIQLLNALSISVGEHGPVKLIALDEPEISHQVLPDLESGITLARQYWPEFQIVEEKVRMETVKAKYAANQVEPRFDFVGGVKNKNLTETSQSVFGKTFSGEHMSWYIGAEYSIPLGNMAARANEVIANVRLDQARLERDALDRTLSNGIYEKLIQIDSLKEQLKLFEDGIKLEREQAKIQNELLGFGRIPIRNVLEQQEKLIDYERRLSNAVVQLKLGEASLQKAVGTLLTRFDIELEELSAIAVLPSDSVSELEDVQD